MNLLVTGGCGFIGSNFINYYFFENTSCNIFNLDAMYYCANEANIDLNVRLSNKYKLVKGNLCSFDLIKHILELYEIDVKVCYTISYSGKAY